VLRGRERMEHVLAGPTAGLGDGGAPAPHQVREGPPPLASRKIVRAARAAARASSAARRDLQARRRRERARRADLPAVVQDERGLAFELETREELERFLVNGGHFEDAELALLTTYLDAGMTAFDVGANVGVFTAAFANSVGERGAVHSFEPLPGTRRRLERTVTLNGFRQVVVNECAVADRAGHLELHDYGPGYESWASLAPREVQTDQGMVRTVRQLAVDVVTLDEYCERHGIAHLHLLKIDVEGAEERVLRGASALLECGAVDLVMVEVADTTLAAAGSRAHDLIDLLEQFGFWTYTIEGTSLRSHRIAGQRLTLTNVVAASARARARLRRLGPLSPA
jgi:FkbM family methyltransferase